ncbi:response regulator [Ancylomarina sp. DW003]|nr:response regulator [Ancylomarina sp. DW003]MDE5420764.1 response regulator [Ancylomarina sp. DW003]
MEKIERVCWEENIDSCIVVKTELEKRNIPIKEANILLVEDKLSNRKTIEIYLRSRVGKIEVAENGKEAVEKFANNQYDMILMDLQMPIMGGIEAAQRIREMEEDRKYRVPIVAFSANYFSSDKETSIEVGMDAYISKPFQSKTLFNLMEEFI